MSQPPGESREQPPPKRIERPGQGGQGGQRPPVRPSDDDEAAAQRWRDYAPSSQPSQPSQPTDSVRGAVQTYPPSARQPPAPPGPGGLSARTMALSGSTVIAVLIVLVLLYGALPGSDRIGIGQPNTTSTLAPAAVSPTPGSTGPAGPSCARVSGDLLCWEKSRDQQPGTPIHDPLISVLGPGTLSDTPAQFMIDGEAGTSWVSAGDAAGGSVLLRFNEPVTVAQVGLSAGTVPVSTDPLVPSSPAGRITAVTWSFASQDGSRRACGLSGDDFGHEVSQDLASSPTMSIPPVTTCSVRLTIDDVASSSGSGSVVVAAISELILRTG